MRLLLDSNALLWTLDDDARLGPQARAAIDGAEALAVSVATLWEIAIKVSIGKLDPIPELYETVDRLGLVRLPISDGHLRTLEALPLHHRDPFDRLLISQAADERLTVLTADAAFRQYGVDVVDAER